MIIGNRNLYLVYDGGDLLSLTSDQVIMAIAMAQSPTWAMQLTGRPNLHEREYVMVLAEDKQNALKLAGQYDAGNIQPDNQYTPYGVIVCLS